MKSLTQLLKSLKRYEIAGSADVDVTMVTFDSRAVVKAETVNAGPLYVAQRGTQTDGHKYIPQAIESGAKVIVCEEMPTEVKSEVTYVRVPDITVALGHLAAAFFDNPSRKLKLVGITGTNGKTTTVTLLHRLFMQLGQKAGLLSTIVNKIGWEEVPATHTTPDAVELMRVAPTALWRSARMPFVNTALLDCSSPAVFSAISRMIIWIFTKHLPII